MNERQWWCEFRRAWIRPDGPIAETDQHLAMRGEPMPNTVGRWLVEAFKALGVEIRAAVGGE